MNNRGKMAVKVLLVVIILAAGLYSINYTNFLSKANPVRLVKAIQSFSENNRNMRGGHFNSKFRFTQIPSGGYPQMESGQAPSMPGNPPDNMDENDGNGRMGAGSPSGDRPSPGNNSGFRNGFGPGAGGPPPMAGGNRGDRGAGLNPFGNVLAYLGVFAFILTITYLIDQAITRMKVRKALS